MNDSDHRVAATCRICGRQLTVAEFRACNGFGHYCDAHLPTRAKQAPAPRAPPRRVSLAPPGSRRGRRISETGVVSYSCKAQFASDGVIRRGRLTTDHPSSTEGSPVFVCKGVGYGPVEIAMLFIRDPDGRSLAQRAGFSCHE